MRNKAFRVTDAVVWCADTWMLGVVIQLDCGNVVQTKVTLRMEQRLFLASNNSPQREPKLQGPTLASLYQLTEFG